MEDSDRLPNQNGSNGIEMQEAESSFLDPEPHNPEIINYEMLDAKELNENQELMRWDDHEGNDEDFEEESVEFEQYSSN